MFSIKRIIAVLIFLPSLVLAGTAHAQVVTEELAMHFGRWAVISNAAPYHITLQPDGSYANSPELIMLVPPTPGRYRISGLPPGAAVTVTVTQINPMEGSIPPQFNLDNFVTSVPNADGGGETVLSLGARARTTGGGGSYADDTYTGQLNLDINF